MNRRATIWIFAWMFLVGVVHESAYAEPACLLNSPEGQSVSDELQNGAAIDPWELMLAAENGLREEEIAAWDSGMGRLLDHCRAKSQNPSVDFVFRTLRTAYLKTYQEGASTAEVFRSGRFNCLSGSALVGLGMQMMGWEVEFRVEPTHVYLLVQQGGKWYRIEATAEDFGAIRTKGKLEGESVGWVGLAGLQCYNSGLVALDAGNLDLAAMDFAKAWSLNPDIRVREMLNLVGYECRTRAESAFEKENWAEASHWMGRAALCGDVVGRSERIWVSSLLMEASQKATVADAYIFLQQAASQSSTLLSNLDFATSLAEAGLAYSIEQMTVSWTAIGGLGVLSELEGSLALESLPVDPELRSRAYGLAEYLSRAFEDADMMASNR